MKLGSKLAIILFILVAVSHALRLIFGVELIVDGMTVPVWVSALGVIVPVALAILLWRENSTKTQA